MFERKNPYGKNILKLKLLKLEGGPYEIGYNHGRDGKIEIRNFLNVIINHAVDSRPGLSKEKVLSQTKPYVPFIKAYAPHLGEEIKGIAEGAKISLEEAYLLQLRGEFTQLSVEGELSSEGCTSFCFQTNMTEDGQVWVGQNLDINSFYKDFGVILHITPKKGPVILCYSQIGSLGHMGINSVGIGLAINTLFSLSWRPGISRSILCRLILEKESVSEAIDVITDAERASSCNYLISHKSGEIIDIETTVEHYGIMNIQGNVMVHTNHFMHQDLVEFEKMEKDKLKNSQFREYRFRQLLTKHQGELSIKKLKEFLTDHEHYPMSICRHSEGTPGNIMTIASMIAQPTDGLIHVSLEQGCKNEYITYSL